MDLAEYDAPEPAGTLLRMFRYRLRAKDGGRPAMLLGTGAEWPPEQLGQVARWRLVTSDDRELWPIHGFVLTDFAGHGFLTDWRERVSLEALAGARRAAGVPLTVPEVAAVGAAVARVLGKLDAHGLLEVRGELTEANVLFDRAGNLELALFPKGPDDDGTPPEEPRWPVYLAPERVFDREPNPSATPAEQFVLGAMLFRLLTGRHPFGREESPVSMLEGLFKGERKPLPGGIDPFFGALLERCLKRRPADRLTGTFPDLAAAFDQCAPPGGTFALRDGIAALWRT